MVFVSKHVTNCELTI